MRAAAPLVVSAFLALAVAAVGASGADRSDPAPIPDSAFGPVVLLPGVSAPPQALVLIRPADLGVLHDPWVVSTPLERAQAALPEGLASYVGDADNAHARSTVLSQAIHHATEHRAQIAGALATNGIDAIDLDAIDLWAYAEAEAGGT
jgi:hypothetical protein